MKWPFQTALPYRAAKHKSDTCKANRGSAPFNVGQNQSAALLAAPCRVKDHIQRVPRVITEQIFNYLVANDRPYPSISFPPLGTSRLEAGKTVGWIGTNIYVAKRKGDDLNFFLIWSQNLGGKTFGSGKLMNGCYSVLATSTKHS